MPRGRRTTTRSQTGRVTDAAAGLAETLANKVLSPFDAVVLTRERIEQTLEEATQRGRITRSDANELVSELLRRGREQTEELLSDLGRRARSGSADLIARGADRARRKVGAGTAFPILGYESLSVQQVRARIAGLNADELRLVREYEADHAKRKTLLAALDRALRTA